jgi:hypothetical protein
MEDHKVRLCHLGQVLARCSGLLPLLAYCFPTLGPRRGRGFENPSADGAMRGLRPTRSWRSAASARSAAISAVRVVTMP